MEKKGISEKVKKARIGKGEANEFYRASLQGNRPGVGQEILVRFGWKTATHTYEMIINMTGDFIKPDHPKFKLLRQTLESLEIAEK
jgi:hypothetical protein